MMNLKWLRRWIAIQMFVGVMSVLGQDNDAEIERFIQERTGLEPPANVIELAQADNRLADLVDYYLDKERLAAIAAKSATERSELINNIDRLAALRLSASNTADDIRKLLSAASKQPGQVDPKAEKVDLRKIGWVTAVKDQKACGSCWAFGTIAAYESSYAKINSGKLVDCSEQSLVSCSGVGSCKGGLWASKYLRDFGAASEKEYPYKAKGDPCMPDIARPFKAVNFGWVSGQREIPTVDEIKTAVANHGALIVAVRVTPNMVRFLRRKAHGEVFDENDNRQVNHAVTLVGWDHTKRAWLIKNSWGTELGDAGFFYIKYTANSIGFAAQWIDAQNEKFPVSSVAVGAILEDTTKAK